jgi:hypothetical protein
MCKVFSSAEGIITETIEVTNHGDFLSFKTLHDLLAHKRQFHVTSSKPRGRSSNGTAEPKLAKPRRRANQHTVQAEANHLMSAADLLTGTPTPTSELPCLKVTCLEVFLNEESLASHCCNLHGMAEVEITEGLRERSANEGGVFWVSTEYDELDEEEEAWFNALVCGLQQTKSDIDDNLQEDKGDYDI